MRRSECIQSMTLTADFSHSIQMVTVTSASRQTDRQTTNGLDATPGLHARVSCFRQSQRSTPHCHSPIAINKQRYGVLFCFVHVLQPVVPHAWNATLLLIRRSRLLECCLFIWADSGTAEPKEGSLPVATRLTTAQRSKQCHHSFDGFLVSSVR